MATEVSPAKLSRLGKALKNVFKKGGKRADPVVEPIDPNTGFRLPRDQFNQINQPAYDLTKFKPTKPVERLPDGSIPHKGTVVDFIPPKPGDKLDDLPIAIGVPINPSNNRTFRERLTRFAADWGDDIISAIGLLAFIDPGSEEDDIDPITGEPKEPELCYRMSPSFVSPREEIEKFVDSVNALTVAPAALKVSAAQDKMDIDEENMPTMLNPLPNDGNQWFRTAAGECRKWLPHEKKLIKAAMKKRKAMKDAYVRKYGCLVPKRICHTRQYKPRFCASSKRCSC